MTSALKFIAAHLYLKNTLMDITVSNVYGYFRVAWIQFRLKFFHDINLLLMFNQHPGKSAALTATACRDTKWSDMVLPSIKFHAFAAEL